MSLPDHSAAIEELVGPTGSPSVTLNIWAVVFHCTSALYRELHVVHAEFVAVVGRPDADSSGDEAGAGIAPQGGENAQ